MGSRYRFVLLLGVVVSVGWLLTACVRPAPGGEGTPTAVSGIDMGDPNVGGGVAGDMQPTAGTPTEAAYPAAGDESMPETVPATTAATAVPATATAAPTAETAVSDEATPTATTAPTAVPSMPTEAPAATAAAGQVTHVVQPGENLFRIGLQYGISWVTLAQYNGLSNPNDIYVGQTLVIPPAGAAPPTATAAPPSSITYYEVQPGDNLFRIGQKFGISWVQIAEANGLVNPNQITVGQTLKIPVNAPGPTPEFTHVVKQGETIFRIAVQYGVPWLSIAEANNIQSPYVIYAGQTLIIPGS
ncbi:MAG: LysM peptidoglycan-binding domain-containing protein [Ardenticatenaceae bacterium]|nr:LysM peptidoglycan-binding domain-containing protein [Ardenticatenaceae bacterium]